MDGKVPVFGGAGIHNEILLFTLVSHPDGLVLLSKR